MSGGHWDYNNFRLSEILHDVGEDGHVVLNFPKAAQIFRDLAEVLDSAIHDLDWHICGDTEIENFTKFEEKLIEDLGKVISKKFKVRVYEAK